MFAKVTTMTIWQLQETIERTGIEEWGAGYFTIDKQGSVVCTPTADSSKRVGLPKVIEEAKKHCLTTPLIIRFPQIIENQLSRMHDAFNDACGEFSYEGKYFGLFPFKVNQRREFIDAIVSCGRYLNWGLEVGSKSEFMAALSYTLSKNSLLICNGFKDEEFIDMAFISAAMGRNIICVVEGPDELQLIRKGALNIINHGTNRIKNI